MHLKKDSVATQCLQFKYFWDETAITLSLSTNFVSFRKTCKLSYETFEKGGVDPSFYSFQHY